MPGAAGRGQHRRMDRTAARRRATLGLGLAALAAAAGGLRADVLPAAEVPLLAAGPFAGIPDLEIRYYEVTGSTAEEIRASMDKLRPADPRTGERFDAYTRWDVRWHVPGGSERTCRLDRATVNLHLTVTLPRLVDRAALPPATRERWERFAAWAEAHEAGHARIAAAARDDVLSAIRRADCRTFTKAAEAAMDALQQRSDAFDRADPDDWDKNPALAEVD